MASWFFDTVTFRLGWMKRLKFIRTGQLSVAFWVDAKDVTKEEVEGELAKKLKKNMKIRLF